MSFKSLSTHLRTHLHILHHLPLIDLTFPSGWQNLTVQASENIISKSAACCFLTRRAFEIDAGVLSSLLRFYGLTLASHNTDTVEWLLTSSDSLPCPVSTLSNSTMLLLISTSSISDAVATDHQCDQLCRSRFDVGVFLSVSSSSSSDCLVGSDEPSLDWAHFHFFIFGNCTSCALKLLSFHDESFFFCFCTYFDL